MSNKKIKCDVCFHPGFKIYYKEYMNRPGFRCDHCGHSWTSGKDGKPYIDYVMNPEDIRNEQRT